MNKRAIATKTSDEIYGDNEKITGRLTDAALWKGASVTMVTVRVLRIG